MTWWCVSLRILVQQPCHIRYTTVVVPGRATLWFLVRLGVPHVGPGCVVRGEHQLVVGVVKALLGESQAESFSSGVKSFKF